MIVSYSGDRPHHLTFSIELPINLTVVLVDLVNSCIGCVLYT